MTTQTLTRVTLQTLENYRAAATKGIAAYRVGGHRLVGAVNGALKNKVYPRTAKVVPRATHRMNEFRGNFTSNGAILRAPWPAARVNAVDLRAAAASPGIRAVLPAREGAFDVMYYGQEIAALAGTSRQAVMDATGRPVVDIVTLLQHAWADLPALR